MKIVKKILKEEDGQALVLVALMMVVLIGFAAIAVDIGMVTWQKSNLQNAADAAALAGAMDLPNKTSAEDSALDLAGKNGIKATKIGIKKEGDTIQITTPYKGNSEVIEVICTRNVQYSFARILGLTDTDVTARAVAKKNPVWAGEALPFINLDDDYLSNPKIEAWEKTGPGDFESLYPGDGVTPSEYHMFNLGKNDDHSQGYFTVDYEDGITIKKGRVAKIKDEVGYVFDQNKPVYLFSLSSDVIKSGKYEGNKLLKNKFTIPLKDIVLLQVTFDSYDKEKTANLTKTKVFDINNGEFPTDYLNSGTKGKSSLID